MPGRVYEEWKEGHVEDDRLRVEQRDDHGLPEKAARLHVEDRRRSGLRHDHADAEPGEVDGARVLDITPNVAASPPVMRPLLVEVMIARLPTPGIARNTMTAMANAQ
jgi:hypothetical protein